MKCLTEIAGVTVPHYDEKFIALFTETMTQVAIRGHPGLECLDSEI